METNNKRPKVVQAPEGCKDYLTPGKNYNVIDFWGEWAEKSGFAFKINSDDGHGVLTVEKGAIALNGNDWIIVETE